MYIKLQDYRMKYGIVNPEKKSPGFVVFRSFFVPEATWQVYQHTKLSSLSLEFLGIEQMCHFLSKMSNMFVGWEVCASPSAWLALTAWIPTWV